MRGLPSLRGSDALRTRRWDAVILGSAVPGLVAGILLGRHGRRVLVLEEDAPGGPAFAGLREPFFATPAAAEEPLGACLRALGIPLIDQRRIEAHPVAFQVVLPEARIDFGALEHTVAELSGWGLVKASEAQPLLAALAGASVAARDALLSHPVVQPGWRGMVDVLRSSGTRSATRLPLPETAALPGELATAPRPLALVLAACLAALCGGRGDADDPAALPELARARLLGAALGGAGRFEGGLPRFRELLRRRLQALYGEIRPLRGKFRFVTVSGQPGVALSGREEVCVGRALILNAPESALASCLEPGARQEFLEAQPLRGRRLALHFRASRDLIPEGMAPRVVLVPDPERPPRGSNLVTLQWFGRREDRDHVDLVAASTVALDEPDPGARERTIEGHVQRLLPFFEGRLLREATPALRWDGDDWLPALAGGAWPAGAPIRRSRRPPVYSLARGELACLGFEGDLLLGWRAGSSIASDLS